MVLRGMANHPNDYFMYVATEDSTYITVDGTTILTNGGPGDAGTYSMTGNANTPGKPFIIESRSPFMCSSHHWDHQPRSGTRYGANSACGLYWINLYSIQQSFGFSDLSAGNYPSSSVANLNYNGNQLVATQPLQCSRVVMTLIDSGVYIGPNTLTNNFTLDCIRPSMLGFLRDKVLLQDYTAISAVLMMI